MNIRLDPFRGVRFNPKKAGPFDRLLSPPYDVIDPEERERLFARSERNIARAIRADTPGDYSGVARMLREWREEGALERDEEPALYVYEEAFSVGGEDYRRTGIIGLVGLGEEGGVVPHERTLSGPKSDRLELLRATRMTFGQIFVLYKDPERVADALCDRAKAAMPLIDTTLDGVEHRLWKMTSPGAIDSVRRVVSSQRLFIADGHHRWETARNFMLENPDMPGAKRRMMTLVNMANPNLVILPIHRVVKGVADFDPAALLRRLGEDFEVAEHGGGAGGRRGMLAAMRAAKAEGRLSCGMWLGDGAHRTAVLRDEASLGDTAPALRRLDVTALHGLVFEKALGIDAAKQAAGENLIYVKDKDNNAAEAAGYVERGEGQAAFFVNPCTPEDVEAVAAAGQRMPQKATFFYPKVYTGLVMHDLESD